MRPMIPFKAKKKPIVVDVIYVPEGSGTEEIFNRVQEFAGDKVHLTKGDSGEVYIPTLEGLMRVIPTDYIIRGVHDEIYPCKCDIFEKTYDILDNNEDDTQESKDWLT